ncbi:hypothetical protein BEWA_030130 [Theileria equi strain WA]|uniref:Uncharacterized protein n=1 Tax=Theileria equi strain WA TaxID=1537102 RepID=L0AYR3_THEEQ|nr:hypothetical protein BEWA_030130 [Theileria equi strain WA]AFZ80161.1 hypothetical protein BEWA_030130 [Theileria equi strain WA]|eukprot:XP_004829827.1 hypothetical protein BEWA_030130 [Theileria equi strain WA]
MASEGVIIDFSQNKNANGGLTTTYYDSTGSSKTITITRSEEPLGSNFYKYTHSEANGQPFLLKAIQGDDGKHTSGIPMNNSVSSVSAYYWKYDNGDSGLPTKALMVKVVETGKTTYYRKSNSDKDWIGPLGANSTPPLINGDLERTLDDLVCSTYNEVIVDLSKSVSFSISTGHKKPYCCRCHGKDKGGSDQQKITVERKNVSCTHKNSVTICKHSIDGNYKLANIRYYLNGPPDTYTNDPSRRRRIKSRKLQFPMDGVKAVYAFYCNHNPVLIYVKGDRQNKWYQKPASNGATDEHWTEVELSGITPSNFSKLECEKYNKLIEALGSAGCGSLPKCTVPPPLPPPLPAQSGQTAATQAQPLSPATAAKAPEKPAEAQTQLPDSEPTSDSPPPKGAKESAPGEGTSEPLPPEKSAVVAVPAATMTLGSISGISSATVVSGSLTGFGWWMFKRSKGDPWGIHVHPMENYEQTTM